MFVIIHPIFNRFIFRSKHLIDVFLLKGYEYDNFDVIHITGFIKIEKNSIKIPNLKRNEQIVGYFANDVNEVPDFNALYNLTDYIIVTRSGKKHELTFLRYNGHNYNKIDNIETQILDLNSLNSKNKTFSKEILTELKERKVVVIGLGSGGAYIALALAKLGIQNFIFIDKDKLEIHNIVRHICGFQDLGRYKTKAIKEVIQEFLPNAKIQTVEKFFNRRTKDDEEFFEKLFEDVDLILSVSGEHTVNLTLNELIQTKVKVPVVFAGTFDAIRGGVMLRYNPKEDDFCYNCIYKSATEKSEGKNVPLMKNVNGRVVYDRNLEDRVSQPGLGLDIDHFSNMVSRFCIDFLIKESKVKKIYHFDFNLYQWYNRNLMNLDNNSIKFEGLYLYYHKKLNKGECKFH